MKLVPNFVNFTMHSFTNMPYDFLPNIKCPLAYHTKGIKSKDIYTKNWSSP